MNEFRTGRPFETFFGEQTTPFPGAPTQGPYIGRSQIVKRGEQVGLIETMSIGRVGESVTLCLVRQDHRRDDQPANVTPIDILAPLVGELRFGAGGANERCQVDWLNGTLITIPAGSVGLACFYPALDAPLGPAADFDQEVGVFIAEGIRPPSAGHLPMARFTVRVSIGAALGPGSTAVVLVPNRAHAVTLMTTDPLNYGSYLLTMRSSPSSSMAGGVPVLAADFPAGPDEVILPNGTRSISVQNLAPVAADLSFIFSLAL